MQSRHCKHWMSSGSILMPALTRLTGLAMLKERTQKGQIMLRCRAWVGKGVRVGRIKIHCLHV